MTRNRYSEEFKRETVSLVVEQGHSVLDASNEVNTSFDFHYVFYREPHTNHFGKLHNTGIITPMKYSEIEVMV